MKRFKAWHLDAILFFLILLGFILSFCSFKKADPSTYRVLAVSCSGDSSVSNTITIPPALLIYDLTGRQIRTDQDTIGLEPGFYFMRYKTKRSKLIITQ